MKKSTMRAIRAFTVAPMVPPFLFFLVDSDHAGHSMSTFVGVMTFGAVYTYPTALIVGVPAYWLINELSQLRATHILAIAAAVGAAVFSMMARGPSYQAVLAGAALGVSAGLAFWLLWRAPAAEPAVADGRGPRLRSDPRR
ncbi:MAG TPA: hypothetical protein VGL59_25675 [Polyangia bacterium]|jgi:hypothetical protein